MADQPIETTPAAGHVTLPDGRVVPTLDTWFNQQANNPQGMGAAEQRTQLSQQYSSNVAAPLTDALGNFISTNPVSMIAEKTGLLSPETNKSVSRTLASAVVPQDLTQAGIDAGVIASGGALAPLKLGRGMQAAGRVMGGVAGGTAGGALDTGTPQGALGGAARGAVQSGVGETAAGLRDYSRTMGVQRAKRLIQDIDAKATGEALERMPSLHGVYPGIRDAAGLEDLTKGFVTVKLPDGREQSWAKYYKQLADFMDGQHATVQTMLDKAKQQGRDYRFPLIKDEAGKDVAGAFGTWDESMKQFSDLGRRAFGGVKGQALEPTIAGVDSKQLHAETRRLIQAQLTLADPSGAALKAFNDGQEAYAAGRAIVKNLRPAFGTKEANRVAYNSDVVQRALSDKRADLVKKLGPDGY
mgnify:FL=1